MRWTATGLNSVSLDEAAEERCALDLERVVCRLTEIERQGARAFAIGAGDWPLRGFVVRSEEHTSELQSRLHLVCRLLLEKKNQHPQSPRRAQRGCVSKNVCLLVGRRPDLRSPE